MNAYVETVWNRTRQLRIGFLAGLIVGLLGGWFFHGLISLVVRFFFVIVLLIPFAVALIAWWRLRREVRRVRAPRDEVDEWPSYPTRLATRRRPSEPGDAGSAITVDSWDPVDAWDAWETPEPRGARRRGPDE